jgi:hypothetical protein
MLPATAFWGDNPGGCGEKRNAFTSATSLRWVTDDAPFNLGSILAFMCFRFNWLFLSQAFEDRYFREFQDFLRDSFGDSEPNRRMIKTKTIESVIMACSPEENR